MYKEAVQPGYLTADRTGWTAYPIRYCKTFAASMIISGVARRQ